MRKPILLFILFLTGLFLFAHQPVNAQEKSAGPINRYVRNEGLADDFVVEFLIPSDSTYRVEASGDKEKRVLGASAVSNSLEGNKRRIVVTTGLRARKGNLYFGNIDNWANSLTVYYKKLEPRGPQNQPRRPNK